MFFMGFGTMLMLAVSIAIGLMFLLAMYGEEEGPGIVNALFRFFFFRFPEWFRGMIKAILGERVLAGFDYTLNYVFNECNPLVQIFYMVILLGSYVIFVRDAYTNIPNDYAAGYHKFLGLGVFYVCLSSFAATSFMDPGIITARNALGLCNYYEYDEAIFSNPNAICETCQTRKPARSKHDSRCNVCVARFDHHCIWVNNTVGLRNHRYFLLFLLSNCLITAYGAFLGATVMLHKIDESNLMKATFIDMKTGERVSASWTVVVRYLFAQNGMLSVVLCLCTGMCPILFGFFGWHIFIAAQGTTTNERDKWKQVSYYLKKLKKEGKEVPDVRNVYDKGVLSNLREVLFPPDVDQFIANTMDKPGTKRRKDKRT
jgi:palmitoyltransferase